MLAGTNAFSSHQELDHANGYLGVGRISGSLSEQCTSSLKVGGSWLQHTTILEDAHVVGEHWEPDGQSGAGDRDRTGMTSLEGWGSTIELHPQCWVDQRSRV